jgi:hypothetical protein
VISGRPGYLTVRLVAYQALYRRPLSRGCQLVLSSKVGIALPDGPIESIHSTVQIPQGKPHRQSVNAVLASAIPTTAERMSIQVEMVGDSKSLFKPLAGIVNAGAFATIATLVPQVAIVVAPIQKAISRLIAALQSSNRIPIMNAAYEFDLSRGVPAAGYYAFLGSANSRSPLPLLTAKEMRFVPPDQLTSMGGALTDSSWVVLEVSTRAAIGREYGSRGGKRPWYVVLELALGHVRDSVAGTALTRRERDGLRKYVSHALSIARSFFLQDRSYLPAERDQILEEAFVEMTEAAAESTEPLIKGLIEGATHPVEPGRYLFSTEVGDVLGVGHMSEIESHVSQYRAVLTSQPDDLANFLGY